MVELNLRPSGIDSTNSNLHLSVQFFDSNLIGELPTANTDIKLINTTAYMCYCAPEYTVKLAAVIIKTKKTEAKTLDQDSNFVVELGGNSGSGPSAFFVVELGGNSGSGTSALSLLCVYFMTYP